MPKKGPGRSLKLRPGPKLTPKSNILSIPHKEFEDTILKEVLDDAEFSFFTNLPKSIKDSYINTLKNSLFNISGKTEAPQAINFSEAEYQDLSGVQVNISLDPQKLKDPDKYIKDTLNRWAKSLINWDDIDREIEKEIAVDLMKGGNGTVALKDSKLLEGHTFTNRVTGVPISQAIEGATGIDQKYDYKDYATQVLNFIDDSQAIGKRDQGVLSTRAKFYELLSKELYKNQPTADPAAKKWLGAEDGRIPAKMAMDGAAVGSFLDDFINKLPDSPNKTKLQQLFIESLKDGEFSGAFDKKLFKNGISLHEISSGISVYDHENYLSRLKFLDTVSFTWNKDVTEAVKASAKANWKELGYSSQAAVDQAFAAVASKDYGTAVSGRIVPGLFSAEARLNLLKVPGRSGGVLAQDLVATRNLLESITDSAGKAKGALVGAMEKNFRFHESDYINAVAEAIPDPALRTKFIDNADSIKKWKDYVHIRATALSYGEFIDIVRDRKLLNTYFFLGKYNSALPKEVQDVFKKINNIPLPLNPVGIRKMGDIQDVASSTKDFVAYKLGLAADVRTYGYYTNSLNPLVRLSKNHTYMYSSDFMMNNQYKGTIASYYNDQTKVLSNVAANTDVNFTLFPGRSYEAMKDSSAAFKRTGLFGSYDPGVLLLFAEEMEGLPGTFEGLERMMDFVRSNGGNVNQMHNDFATWFDLWKQSGNMDFFDTLQNRLAKGTIAVTPEEMTLFKDSFQKIFKSLDKIQQTEHIDSKDFFSFVFTVAKDKGFLKGAAVNGVKGQYMLYRYMPVLNSISSHLNQLQTYAIRFTENKILNNTVFKYVPGTEDLWNIMVRPGVGAYDFVNTKLQPWLLNQFSRFRLDTMFRTFVNSPIGTAVKAFLARALPGFVTAAGFASFGTSFLVYAVARYGKATMSALMGVLKGNFKAVYYEFLNATNDIFVVPVKFLGKIVLYILLGVVGILAILLLLLVPGVVRQERELSTSSTEYGQLIPLELRDGKYCVSKSFGGKDYELLRGNLALPIKGSTSYDVGQCPGYSETYEGFHGGIDISGMKDGASVRTPFLKDNQCWTLQRMSTGWNDGYGNLVVISTVIDGKSFYFYFAHNESFNESLTIGQTYCNPEVLSYADTTGNSTGTHVHFEIRSGTASLNDIINPCSVIACPDGCFTKEFSEACIEDKVAPSP